MPRRMNGDVIHRSSDLEVICTARDSGLFDVEDWLRLLSDVGEALEVLLRVAARTGHTRHIVAPLEAPLRSARVCYDHLAGESGVRLFTFLRASNYVVGQEKRLRLSAKGKNFADSFGISTELLEQKRRPLCRVCLDWSEKTHHLGGVLGAAMLDRMMALKWLKKQSDSRAVHFTSNGKKAFAELTGSVST